MVGEKQRCRIEIDSVVVHFSNVHHVCICLFPVLVLSFPLSYRFSPALTLPLHCISNCSFWVMEEEEVKPGRIVLQNCICGTNGCSAVCSVGSFCTWYVHLKTEKI